MEAIAGNNPRPEPADRAPGSRRRHRRTAPVLQARYFLPKPGSSSDQPELGQEAASESAALVEAFQATQVFYTLVAWKAVPEMNGSEAKIIKRPLTRE
jgi:hypothetical protein